MEWVGILIEVINVTTGLIVAVTGLFGAIGIILHRRAKNALRSDG